MKLVADWKDGWRWFSIHAMLLTNALLGSWAALPEKIQASIPLWLVLTIAICLLTLGTIGRLVDQPRAQ